MNTMGRAGAERALIELMRVLDPEKYRISLYVLIPRGELFSEVPEYVRILNRRTDSRSVLSAGGKLFVAARLVKTALYSGSMVKAFKRISKNRKAAGEQRGALTLEKVLRRMLADGSAALPGGYDLAVAYLE